MFSPDEQTNRRIVHVAGYSFRLHFLSDQVRWSDMSERSQIVYHTT